MKRYPITYNPILEYWEEIQSGKTKVSRKIYKTFEHVVKQNHEPGEYFYNPKRANHILEFAENYCVPLTKDTILRNRYIPRKTLRKDECAVFFYNLSPYALLNRLQTARFAKLMLPNFFSAEQTINSVFTRFANSSSDEGFTIENLPYHSTTHLEKFLFELGLKNNHKNNERK